MVWSMISQLSSIKVVFDKRLRLLLRRENGKKFQINLERNDNQQESLLSGYAMYYGITKHLKMIQIYHFSLLKLLYFSCKNDAE